MISISKRNLTMPAEDQSVKSIGKRLPVVAVRYASILAHMIMMRKKMMNVLGCNNFSIISRGMPLSKLVGS